MKGKNILGFLGFIVAMWGCEKEEVITRQDYEFIKKYCASVTVGGFVGIAERCFEIGDVVTGYKKNEATITIRIAEHSRLNEGPPTSASYQELLDVPSYFLKLKKR